MEDQKVQNILIEFNKIRNNHPIIFLDYDGTLVPIIKNPEESYPDNEIMEILNNLRKKYELYIVTGRSLREIREFIGPSFNVMALHGAILSLEDGTTDYIDDYSRFRQICDNIYRKKQDFTKKYPGVQIINKDGGLVFTKWYVSPDLYEKLQEEIRDIANQTGMYLYLGKMIVELRIPGADKGKAIKDMRKGRPALVAGDDITDEDAFKSNPDTISVHIGKGETVAKHTLDDYRELRDLLVLL